MGPTERCTLGSMYLRVQMMLQGIQSCPEWGMLQPEGSKDTDRSQGEMPWRYDALDQDAKCQAGKS